MPIILGTLLACLSLSSCTMPETKEEVRNENRLLEVTIKKSSTGICHDASSKSYTRTKNFTPYTTMDLCIADGGRAHTGFKNSFDLAEEEAVIDGRDFISLYNRNDWPHWIDKDGDCQNTRHELLLSTTSSSIEFSAPDECNVISGSWFDPYSGETLTTSKDLDLDHIVPLKFAHGHGGDKWPRDRKQLFANDLDNLLLVQASLNRQKGAKGPSEWMPPNQFYRCEYLQKFVFVMDKYELKFIPSEQRVVNRMTKACLN